jgi:hypothetical protein
MERFVLWHRILPPAFEQEETTAAAGQWARYVTNEVEAAGGEVMSSLAGTVVAAFELRELKAGINLALRLLSEAEGQPVPAGGLPIAFGIATGEVRSTKDPNGAVTGSGSAIDQAQLLANQARAGEVVLDVESREAASRTYLFGRTVSTQSFALRGEVIDRAGPLLEDCRRAVGLLETAPVPASLRHALEPVKQAAAGASTAAFYLKGPLGSGARDAVFALRDQMKPPLFLDIGAVPGGLEPLGGLRLALLKAWRRLEPTRQALKANEPGVADALKAIACATPPRRDATVHALRITLQALQEHALPWIYVDRLAAVDPATLDVLGAVLSDERSRAVVLVRTTDDSVPASLRPIPNSTRIDVPSLDPNEALVVAAAILGPNQNLEIAKQLVITGGTSVLGIVEAARTMIATGDLIHDGQTFQWRDEFAERRQYIGPRALLEERFGTLDTSSMRFLEVACSALPASSAQVIDAAVALDGVAKDTRKRALDALVNDGLLSRQGKPESELLRRAVVQRMPPGRRTEVYRFVAQALHSAEPLVGPSMAATVGVYLCEGGDTERGAHALLEAGSLAADLGYDSAAVRLAAAAVQYQPDGATRSVASEISKSVRLPSAPPADAHVERPKARARTPEPPPPTKPAVVVALEAGDHVTFDDLIAVSIAGGGDLVGAHCLRVLSYVARLDLRAAKKALRDAKRAPNRGASGRIRLSIASACLHLAYDQPRNAMIDSLEALRTARATEDGAGEAAALKMVSAACLAAGLESDADRLAHVAEAVAS